MQLREDARTIVLLDLEGLTEGEVAAVRRLRGGHGEVAARPRAPALRQLLQDYAR